MCYKIFIIINVIFTQHCQEQMKTTKNIKDDKNTNNFRCQHTANNDCMTHMFINLPNSITKTTQCGMT